MDKAPASLVGEMSIMDTSGHKQLTWKMNDPGEISAAKQTFDALLREGYSAFGSRTKNDAKHTVKEFNPELEDLVLVPRTVGG